MKGRPATPIHATSQDRHFPARERVPRLGALGAVLALAALALAPAALAKVPDWGKAEPVVMVRGLELPADIEVAPDGAIWFVEVAGNVTRHDPERNETTRIRHVEDVQTGVERGLVGLALAHDFQESGIYYLYYTQRTEDPKGGLNRLVKVVDGTEVLLATVPGATEHNGGRIAVAPNGTLFVGTGENQLRDPAQDPKSLLGKVLRMTPDGQPVPGNLEGIVYSRGHRNVYGLALHPETGDPWSTENSGWRRDEVNIVKAGGNYGYPECEGHGLNGVDTPCPTNKGYTFPLRTFYEDRAVAPTGATFWRGEFYWASLNEGSIHHLWQDAATKEWKDEVVFKHPQGQPILDLAVGPDDDLFFSTMDEILRISLPDEDRPAGTHGTPPGTGTKDTTSPSTGVGPDTGTTKDASAPSLALVVLVVAGMFAWGRARRGT